MLNPLEQAELEQLHGVIVEGKTITAGMLIGSGALVTLAYLTPAAAPILLLGAICELIGAGFALSKLGRLCRRRDELEGFLP